MGVIQVDMREMTREMRLKHWLGIIQDRTSSNKSVRAYCRDEGIKEKSYYCWQRQLRKMAAEMKEYSENSTSLAVAEPAFAELPLSAKPLSNSITIRIGNTVVEIDGHADSQTLETILKVLC